MELRPGSSAWLGSNRLMPQLWPADHRVPRFDFLLVGMFLELLLAPLIDTTAGGVRVARLVMAIVLLAALPVVGARRSSLALFIPALLAQLAASYSSASAVAIVAATFRLLFLCYVTGLVVAYVLRARQVTWDTVAGTSCAYLLLGMVWATLYILVEHARSGSFDIPSNFTVRFGGDPGPALTYFSFVTLTTLGYGVIHPTDVATGGLCVAEALVGQLYLAIMISRMVGLHIAQRPS